MLSKGGRAVYAEPGPLEESLFPSEYPAANGEMELKRTEGVASGSAYAYLDGSGSTADVIAVEGDCSSPPPRDILVWADLAAGREKRYPVAGGHTAYSTAATRLRLGISKELSPAVAAGLWVDWRGADVDSILAGDGRRSHAAGYVVGGQVKATLNDTFLLGGEVFYGNASTDGDGTWSFLDTAGGTHTLNWWEDKHRSSLYGLAATFGQPLVFRGDDSLKVLPEIGIRYQWLKTKAYAARLSNPSDPAAGWDVLAPAQDSASLVLPLTVTARKQFVRRFGTVSPRLTCGVDWELDDSATGVRTYGAAAAAGLNLSDPAGIGLYPYDSARGAYLRFGAGLDLATRGGWAMRADYVGLRATDYQNDEFKLELSRCF